MIFFNRIFIIYVILIKISIYGYSYNIDSITLVISYKYSIEMATGFMIISTIASIIIKYIKDKE